jgi:hypothetical protein
MRLGDSDSYVDIEVYGTVARNMPRSGDLRLKVTVNGAGYRAVQKDVWIRGNSVERFVNDLYAMARGERADAALGGTRSELSLRFSRPMQTHVLVEGKLKRIGPGSPATISAWIAFSVYVEAASLDGLAETIAESWLAPAQASSAHH